MNIRNYKLLGIEINPMSINALNDLVNYLIENPQEKKIISSQNLHSVYLFHKDAKMRSYHQLTYKRVDGLPLILLGKILGYSLKRNERVTWVDYFEPFIKNAVQRQWKIFYVGSRFEVAKKAIEILKHKYRNIKIEFTHGFFNKNRDSNDNTEVLNKILFYNPDILLVGMGMPLQEHWILDNYNNLNAKVILTCGAAMEYFVGVVKTPPRWMGKTGFEWLFRFVESPKRFFSRYLIEPWLILPLIIKDIYHHYLRH